MWKTEYALYKNCVKRDLKNRKEYYSLMKTKSLIHILKINND